MGGGGSREWRKFWGRGGLYVKENRRRGERGGSYCGNLAALSGRHGGQFGRLVAAGYGLGLAGVFGFPAGGCFVKSKVQTRPSMPRPALFVPVP